MRRVLNILDTLRKVRPKVSTEPTSDPKTKLNDIKSCDIERTTSSRCFNNSMGNALTFEYSNTAEATSTADNTEVLWNNLKRVLLICGGQQKPSTSMFTERGSDILVDVLEAQRFVSDIFASLNVPSKAASEMADALIAADYMGQRSMGIHRLPAIAAELLNFTVDPRMQPKLLSERESVALVDGQNAPGPVVANYCMDLAMRKARDQAIGFVAARRSNNIGMASWYACQALAQRLIGLCMSNGPPILVPSGGIEPLLGGNSVAFAAASRQEQFITDLGMSAFPIEQLELEYCNGHLNQLPPKLALDCGGQPTICAAEALRSQRLRSFMPEHKGFGLAAMVDVLCGVMTGARYATQLQRRGLFSTNNEQADLGQIYVAIDPMRFCVSFEERLADFHQLLRNVTPCDVTQPPLIPGDKEMQHMQMVDDQGGLILSPCTLSVLQELGERYNIPPLKTNKEYV